jgi:peptidoglycan hydrolase-like protein with peptidoglycan-binding domain
VRSRAPARASKRHDETFVSRIRALVLGAVVRRPKESIAFVLVGAAAGTIVVNALFLQSGPHPAPIFISHSRPAFPADATGTVIVLPRPRPPEAQPPSRSRAEIITDIQRELARRGFYDGTADGVYGPKTDTAIRDFEQASGLKVAAEPAEIVLKTISQSSSKAQASAPAATPARNDAISELVGPSKRVLAVQRALADFGYGQIKQTGILNPETQAAIEKFERERKLPITGQMSDRLVRELAAMTGRPLE